MDQTTFIDPSATVPVPAGGSPTTNVGDGTISTPVPSSATLTEDFTITCTIPGGANVGEFSVTGSVSGLLGTATSDEEFVDADQKVRFTLTAGGTPWAVDDEFTFSTVAGTVLNEANFSDFGGKVPTPVSGFVRKKCDFFGDADAQEGFGYVSSGGTITQTNELSGVLEIEASLGVAGIISPGTSARKALTSSIRIFNARVATATTGTTNKLVIIGLANDVGNIMNAAGAGRGVFFRVDAGGSGVNIFAVTKNGAATETTTDTGIADSATFREFEIRATSSSIEYYIDGALVATHTTNIPTVAIGSRMEIFDVVGSPIGFSVDDVYEIIPGGRPI